VCCLEFFDKAQKTKEACNKTWILFRINSYGLTPQHLDLLASGGLNSYWSDIKAYNEEN